MRATEQLISDLESIYHSGSESNWMPTSNGRTALELILRGIEGQPGDEVIVQSFTCITAVEPVIWAGLTPVYADIDPSSLSLDLTRLKKLIGPRTKAIIVQHTFGIPGPISEVVQIAREHGVLVIEDCAHSLGLPLNERLLGTLGDAALISFGVDKMLPTVFGGAALVTNAKLRDKVEKVYATLPDISGAESLRWSLYPYLRRTVNQLPTTIAGKVRGALVRAGVQRLAIAPSEYRADRPAAAIGSLPEQHAAKVRSELKHLPAIHSHRENIVTIYRSILSSQKELRSVSNPSGSMLRYPIIFPDPAARDRALKRLARIGVSPITWYDPALFPAGTDYAAYGYDPKACPEAESIARRILALPTDTKITPTYATIIANELIAAATD